MTHEISINERFAPDDTFHDDMRRTGNPRLLLGTTYGTVIKPEFNSVYQRGIVPIIAGVIMTSAAEVQLDSGVKAHSSIFGITEIYNATLGGEPTGMFIANLQKDTLDLFDDPEVAIARYHQNLIGQTNEVLSQVGSAYRLAPIDDAL